MKRTILAYGFKLPDIEGFEAVPISSDRSMLDADVIAVELDLSDFHANGEFSGTPRFSEDSSYRYRKTIQRWKEQVNTALEVGKTVVFFLTKRTERYYYTGERRSEGTPGKPRFTSVVAHCSNYDFLPIRLDEPQFATGTAMVLHSGAELLSEYWRSFGPISIYQCFFQPADTRPLVLTRSGQNVVGVLVPKKGNLLLLPEIQWGHLGEDEDEDDGEDWPKGYVEFTRQLRDALLEIDGRLRRIADRTSAPEWAEAEEYRLAVEPVLEAQIEELEVQIEALVSRRAHLSADLEAQGSLRALLFEGGHPLEDAVRAGLSILGFQTDTFKQGDSEFDALFTSAEGRFLGEVEGKENKPVNVDKFSQLVRNIAEDLNREDVSDPAIPVLFANAFRVQPVEGRPSFFTEKVLKVAPVANVALVRTPDLFVAARHVKDTNDMQFAKECREAIRDGVGGLVVFPKIPNSQ